MDIFMRNVPYTADDTKISLHLASVLHSPKFERYATSPGLPINFKVRLFPDKRYHRNPHSGSGTITVPTEDIGLALLVHFNRGLNVDGRLIVLQTGKKAPRPDILGEVQLLPWRNPQAIREKESRLADFSGHVELLDVQFGWICRDASLSVEWQWNGDVANNSLVKHQLSFHEETREIVVQRTGMLYVTTMATRYSRVQSAETDSKMKAIVLFLETPPSFEREVRLPIAPFLQSKRRKLSHLNASHATVVPFTWSVLRLVCGSLGGLAEFRRMAELANLSVQDHHRSVVSKGLFSARLQNILQEWLRKVDWSVAFQCEALYRDQLLDTVELMDLRDRITELVSSRGPQHTTQVLRQFRLHLRELMFLEEAKTVQSCFNEAKDEVEQSGDPDRRETNADRGLFQCLHVIFTPSGMTLRGPFIDTSNRILRQHQNNQESFLRVSFTDEDFLHFRFNRREVDGPRFIEERVGTILKNGFDLCGRHFELLAYSQSALKQYTVWFVTQFTNNGRVYDAESIRGSIGSSWPTEVLRCPARYAARLSQAFTATEPSLVVEPDQIQRIPDIDRNGYCFSDGCGLVSKSMADEIHDALKRDSERRSRGRRTPSVFQVRIQGAKGVLSVDPTLDDFLILLRPSMVKFESVNYHAVEIARSFIKPGKFFLNRPLIMILGGLGVRTDVFMQLQRDAVEATLQASKSLKEAAGLLEMHGLGSAFALSSTFSNLRKLGLDFEQNITQSGLRDAFIDRCMQFAVHHVLREIKFRARVPVPESWKLVGIVDVHNILRPDQIYACIVRGEGAKPEYLEGPILLSKSPTIHPGDVQMAQAIGVPPLGSPLRTLINCVVFSQQGDRPLPNKLSGSDLDGDEYDLIPLLSLHPPKFVAPGGYPPAPRLLLQTDSTIKDVANFVVNFINNDVLGIVATNFLLIADRDGIFAEDCAKLAELHSWAVDFPKSGVPVPIDKIPQPSIRFRPDWFAPEISTTDDADFYESQTALGKLFRDIQLPRLSAASYDSRAQQRRRKKKESRNISLEDTFQTLSLAQSTPTDTLSKKLRLRLVPLVDLEETEELTRAMSDLFDHFAAELEHICFAYTLSRRSTARLTEEEAFMGTIIAKSAQPRMRRDNIAALRDETNILVRRMLSELEGGEKTSIKDWVNQSWAAWKVSLMKKDLFGSKSFGWIALRAIFESIKHLDN